MVDLSNIPEPGDVIAFEGSGIVPTVIKWATWSPYSHVAIIARPRYQDLRRSDATDKENCHALKSRTLLFESTSLNPLTCLVHQRRVDGVQVHDWRDSIRGYKKVWLYKLRDPLYVDESVRLSEYLCSQLQRCYDFLGAMKSGTRILKHFLLPCGKDLRYLFCSEYVAEALQHCRHWDVNANTSKITPGGLIRQGMNYGVFKEPVRLYT